MSRLHSFSVSGVGDKSTADTAGLPCSLSERVVYVERLSFFLTISAHTDEGCSPKYDLAAKN